MLLTLRTTHVPATDLGFLLHKHPDKLQSFDLPFGRVHVFYPEAAEEGCTAALLLDVDPVGLVRERKGPDQYVNDRPYVASSFLAVAISRVLGTALGGRSQSRQELAERPIPLEARIAVVPCRGGEGFLRRLFEPLGYEVTAEPHPLDGGPAAWGLSRYFTVALRATCRLSDLLSHLYVLIPVLDDVDRLPERQRERISLLHGSLMYRDARIAGFDAAAVVEVVEHLDPPRLAAFERVLFEAARPGMVVLTTPNAEYNVKWESLPAGRFRHRDHRFEWNRAELRQWATGIAGRFGDAVRFQPVGEEDPEAGPPTQMAVFTREGAPG